MKYRKKPVVIDAIIATGTDKSNREVINWTRDSGTPAAMIHRSKNMADGSTMIDTEPTLAIETLEGLHYITPGDFIIKGVKGEFYPCKPDIFDATYEYAMEGDND